MSLDELDGHLLGGREPSIADQIKTTDEAINVLGNFVRDMQQIEAFRTGKDPKSQQQRTSRLSSFIPTRLRSLSFFESKDVCDEVSDEISNEDSEQRDENEIRARMSRRRSMSDISSGELEEKGLDPRELSETFGIEMSKPNEEEQKQKEVETKMDEKHRRQWPWPPMAQTLRQLTQDEYNAYCTNQINLAFEPIIVSLLGLNNQVPMAMMKKAKLLGSGKAEAIS